MLEKQKNCKLKWGMLETLNIEDLLPMLTDIARDRPEIISAVEFRKILIDMGLPLEAEKMTPTETS
jgi:hypothetical protein